MKVASEVAGVGLSALLCAIGVLYLNGGASVQQVVEWVGLSVEVSGVIFGIVWLTEQLEGGNDGY